MNHEAIKQGIEQIQNAKQEIKDTIGVSDIYLLLLKKYQEALIIVESDKSWEEKYDLIFSDEISVQVIPHIDYVDCDMDYEDDVKKFMSDFRTAIVMRASDDLFDCLDRMEDSIGNL